MKRFIALVFLICVIMLPAGCGKPKPEVRLGDLNIRHLLVHVCFHSTCNEREELMPDFKEKARPMIVNKLENLGYLVKLGRDVAYGEMLSPKSARHEKHFILRKLLKEASHIPDMDAILFLILTLKCEGKVVGTGSRQGLDGVAGQYQLLHMESKTVFSGNGNSRRARINATKVSWKYSEPIEHVIERALLLAFSNLPSAENCSR